MKMHESADATVLLRARLGHNGELHEPGTVWQMLGNGYRVYNAILMRFHGADSMSPFGRGSINAYAYCAGDPINFTDPTAHFPLPVGALMAIGALGMGAAATTMSMQGNDKEAHVFGAVAGALGAAAIVIGGTHAFRSLRSVEAAPFKPAGALSIKQQRAHVTVSVHGGRHATRVGDRTLDGVQTSRVLRQHGVDGKKQIKFLSCQSADGVSPQGQVVSNEFGVPVKAYSGTVYVDWNQVSAIGRRKSVMFYPQEGAERAATAIRNTELHQAAWVRGARRRGGAPP